MALDKVKGKLNVIEYYHQNARQNHH